jgi:hypothetical protein
MSVGRAVTQTTQAAMQMVLRPEMVMSVSRAVCVAMLSRIPVSGAMRVCMRTRPGSSFALSAYHNELAKLQPVDVRMCVSTGRDVKSEKGHHWAPTSVGRGDSLLHGQCVHD